jgi:RNA recognition motif-containing protein
MVQPVNYNPAQFDAMMNAAHQSSSPSKVAQMPSLHIGGLSKEVYDMELYKFFERNGFKPYKAKAIIDHLTKKHKGFGYVAFEKKEDAQAAMDKLNFFSIGDKQIRITWKQNKEGI